MAAFRLLRIFRIFRLFKMNSYSDSLGIIAQVLKSKWQQLVSSVILILVLMIFSSLCMYSIEHDAQPEIFSDAFSGIWWSVSTLLTVGYGDIYPITTLGKIFSIIITFLGVGMVAIPTGIISAGFIEQSQKIKRLNDFGPEEAMYLIKIPIKTTDYWAGKMIKDLHLPSGVIVAVIKRGAKTVVPRGDTVVQSGDVIIIGAESYNDDNRILLNEITLAPSNPWVNSKIRDLDISRQSVIVMVKRQNHVMIPFGDMMLLAGDQVVLFSQEKLKDSELIQI